MTHELLLNLTQGQCCCRSLKMLTSSHFAIISADLSMPRQVTCTLAKCDKLHSKLAPMPTDISLVPAAFLELVFFSTM